MAEYPLHDTNKAFEGRFWHPDRPERTSFGMLTLKAGDMAELGLVDMEKGVLGSSAGLGMELTSWRILHGVTSQGENVTLVDCVCFNSGNTEGTAGEGRSAKYRVATVFFGKLYKLDDLRFQELGLRFNLMDEWLAMNRFGNPKEGEDSQDSSEKAIEAKSKFLRIDLIPTTELPFKCSGREGGHFFLGGVLYQDFRKITIESRNYLYLKFHKPISWPDCLREIRQWEWFFSLASRGSCTVSEIDVVVSANKTDTVEKHFSVWRASSLPAGPESNRSRYQMHFTYPDIRLDFDRVISKWFSIQEPWAAVLHRFFAVSGKRTLQANEVFLFLAQAVESLHEARRNGKPVKDANFKNKVLEAVSKALPGLQQFIGPPDVFAEAVRDNRNYYTHYPSDLKRKGKVADTLGLVGLGEKLRFIIESAILTEMGIPAAFVERVFGRRWQMIVPKFT